MNVHHAVLYVSIAGRNLRLPATGHVSVVSF